MLRYVVFLLLIAGLTVGAFVSSYPTGRVAVLPFWDQVRVRQSEARAEAQNMFRQGNSRLGVWLRAASGEDRSPAEKSPNVPSREQIDSGIEAFGDALQRIWAVMAMRVRAIVS